VTDWQSVWLGVIALAMVVMAVAQVAVVIHVARTARDVSKTAVELRQGVKPLLEKVNRIADDAARGTALAVAQVERVDRLLATATERVDETLTAIKNAVVEPLRQGSVIIAALKAVIAAFRSRGRDSEPHDDEDPLFVG
jgi:uncharacterized protein YoxC